MAQHPGSHRFDTDDATERCTRGCGMTLAERRAERAALAQRPARVRKSDAEIHAMDNDRRIRNDSRRERYWLTGR